MLYVSGGPGFITFFSYRLDSDWRACAAPRPSRWTAWASYGTTQKPAVSPTAQRGGPVPRASPRPRDLRGLGWEGAPARDEQRPRLAPTERTRCWVSAALTAGERGTRSRAPPSLAVRLVAAQVHAGEGTETSIPHLLGSKGWASPPAPPHLLRLSSPPHPLSSTRS